MRAVSADVAPVRPGQGRRHCPLRQGRRRVRGGRPAEQLQTVLTSQVIEDDQCGGEELPQRRTQAQDVAGPFPDQVLVRAGRELHAFGQGRVAGDRAVMGPVQADELCQQVGVGPV